MGHVETIELGPGFRVTSYGFLFPDSGIVMETEGVTLFNANDAKFMGLPLRQVLRRHSAIDFVFCGQHGWWQACPEIGAPAYDPFGPEGANFNLIIGNAAIDPISGSVPHRAYLCESRRAK